MIVSGPVGAGAALAPKSGYGQTTKENIELAVRNTFSAAFTGAGATLFELIDTVNVEDPTTLQAALEPVVFHNPAAVGTLVYGAMAAYALTWARRQAGRAIRDSRRRF